METMIPSKNSAFTLYKSGNLKETLNLSRQDIKEFLGNPTRLCSNPTVSIHPISSNPRSEIEVLRPKEEVIENNNLGRQRLLVDEEKMIETEKLVLTKKEEESRKWKPSVLKIVGVGDEARNSNSESQRKPIKEKKQKKMKIECKEGSRSTLEVVNPTNSTSASSISEEQSSRLNNTIESNSSTLLVASITDNMETSQKKKKLLFEKTLSSSDVGDYNRLVIPRRYAEAYFPPLEVKGGKNKIEILKFFDKDDKSWEIKFVFWPRSQSYALTRGWKAFVLHHGLRYRDVARIYKLSQHPEEKHFGIDHCGPPPVIVNRNFRLFGANITCGDEHVSMVEEDEASNSNRRSNGGRRRLRKERHQQKRKM